MCNIKMTFQTSATALVILLTTIITTFAQSDREFLINVADIEDTNRALNLAGLRDDNIAVHIVQRRAIEFPIREIFKRQTTSGELTPAQSELAEDTDSELQQGQLGVIAPVAEIATAAEAQDVPAPTRIAKTFSNSGLRR